MLHSLATNLDGIVGYEVVVTVRENAVLATPIIVGYFDDATSYGMAVAEARALRGAGQYAIARPVYACSCGEAHAL